MRASVSCVFVGVVYFTQAIGVVWGSKAHAIRFSFNTVIRLFGWCWGVWVVGELYSGCLHLYFV